MLAEARRQSQIQFINSAAEKLPFTDSTFDYVNISMAFQWLNQNQFLKEAKRVLKANGILGIDNYGFSGKMNGNDQFLDRYKSFDRQYMQSAPRNKNYPDDSDIKNVGFYMVAELNYQHEVLMNKMQFINYLMTRSNFLELSIENRNQVHSWLNDYYESDFKNEAKTLAFHGAVRLYRFDS
jgi:ubiquinone/menaquinone biosynthesis C-methylase UbiE